MLSGIVVTVQGLFALRMSNVWRQVHLISTFVTLVAVLPHLGFVLVRLTRPDVRRAARGFLVRSVALTVICLAVVAVLPRLYSGTEYVDAFPEDYEYLYGEDRPFAPSLARTDRRSLSTRARSPVRRPAARRVATSRS